MKHGAKELSLRDLAVLRGFGHSRPGMGDVMCLAFSTGTDLLAIGQRSGMIRVWDTGTGTAVGDLPGHDGAVHSIAFNNDGRLLASLGLDGRLRVASVATGRLHFDVGIGFYGNRPIAWDPAGTRIALSTAYGIVELRNSESGEVTGTLDASSGPVHSLAWSESTPYLAAGDESGRIVIWKPDSLRMTSSWRAHAGFVRDIVWLADGHSIASIGEDLSVAVWDSRTSTKTRELEGHTGTVRSLSATAAGPLLASAGDDGAVRLWRIDTWECIATVTPDPGRCPARPLVALHPNRTVVAIPRADSGSVSLWHYNRAEIQDAGQIGSAQYCNAKVVLVGDSGSGKSGLGMVLTNQPFQATESTHGRHVWLLSSTLVPKTGGQELREIYLWDLAGQAHYRLVHQLHLSEVAVALLVFDARSDANQLAGARYWAEAMKRAQLRAGATGQRIAKFLVAARSDCGRANLHGPSLERVRAQLGIDSYVETSAKEGWGVAELRAAIENGIDWSGIPRTTSTEKFAEIRRFVMSEKQHGKTILTRTADLLQRFEATRSPRGFWAVTFEALNRGLSKLVFRSSVAATRHRAEADEETTTQFRTCIMLMESRGLVRRMGFGDLVLLHPEYLDIYASAMIDASKDEPDELGSIGKAEALKCAFRMSGSDRIADSHQEELLLHGTVKDMIDREIAYSVSTEEGDRLVFPSLAPGDGDSGVEEADEGSFLSIRFSGAIRSIYVTLAVRLAHTGKFSILSASNGRVRYSVTSGECGFRMTMVEEGAARLTLSCSTGIGANDRQIFEEFVLRHVRREGDSAALVVVPVLRCAACSLRLDDHVAAIAVQSGGANAWCPVCGVRIPLPMKGSENPALVRSLADLDSAADASRSRMSERTRMDGRRAASDYDVFISYSRTDSPAARTLARALESRGILPWLDRDEIGAGENWMTQLQTQLERTPAALVLVGVDGPHRWQEAEVMALLTRLVETGSVRVIPVILPGADAKTVPLLLRQYQTIDLNAFPDGAPRAEGRSDYAGSTDQFQIALDVLAEAISSRRQS